MMSLDDFRELCKRRRSIRYYQDEPLPREDVLALLELAHLSPSVGNTQPWRFHIVENPSLREALMHASCYGNFVAGASAFVVVTCLRTARPANQEPVWNLRELEYSCMSAMTHVLLGATAMGIGSCWVSLHHGEAHEALKLPPQEAVVGGIMLGRYRSGEKEAGEHHERAPLKDLVTLYE